MKRTWTEEHLKTLREYYPVLPINDLLKLLPFSKEVIKCAASRFKLKKVTKCYSWSYADEQKLIQLYPTTLVKDLMVLFNKTENQVTAAAFKNNLVKDPKFKYEQALKSCFKPGAVPKNKGLKQADYMTPEQIAKTAGTRFKKGQISKNTLYDGAITVRPDKAGVLKKFVRVSKMVWVELQLVNWKNLNGPIPKGHCLWCLTHDRLNCDPSNWELITKAENMRRNSCSLNLTDNYVAMTIAGRNQELSEELKQYPELIDLKRQQLLLNRAIKQKAK